MWSKMHGTRVVSRCVSLAAAATLVVAACGSSDSASENTESSAEDASGVVETTDTTTETASASEPSGDEENVEPATEDEGAKDGEMRTIDTVWGPVDVPLNPQTLIAMDEYSALNLLALGVEPTMVVGTFQAGPPAEIIQGYGIEMIPGSYGQYNFEEIAARRPDLIVIIGNEETEDVFNSLSDIAPTVVIPYIAPWRDVVAFTGELTGHEDAAKTLIAALDSEIEALAQTVQAAPSSVSVLASALGFGAYSIGQGTSISDTLGEVGYTRPEPERQPAALGVSLPTSEELVGDHAADLMVVLGGHEAYFPSEMILNLDVFQAIPAVADGNVVVAAGDFWIGTGPFAVYWVLQDMAAVEAGEGQAGVGANENVAERWAEFSAFAE